MTIETEALSLIPLFKGLPPEDLASLARRVSRRQYPAGAAIFAKNDIGASMYVVLSGRVRLYLPADRDKEPATMLAELKAGDFFGEMALLDNEPRLASAETLTDAVLGELDRTNFLQHLQASGVAVLSILSEMSRRLRWTTELLSNHAARDVDEEAHKHLTMAQRLADRVARWNGSWVFIAVLLGLTGIWIALNQIARAPFDAYPYQFFNLFLAVLVALQGPLIMMSQNRQAATDRLRSETDFRVNLKNEVGIEQILRELSKLKLQISQVAEDDSKRAGRSE